MAVLSNLERGEGFSDLERYLADYILENADDVLKLSIADLASSSSTSKATIIRLCKKLGLKGYRDFRLALSADLERRSIDRHDIDADQPLSEGDSARMVVDSISILMKEAVDACAGSLRVYDIERAARAVLSAGHVHFFAHGDSAISTLAFSNQVMKLGVRSSLATQYHEEPYVAHSVRPGDVVVIVTYSGLLLDSMREYMEFFKTRKAYVILISSAPCPFGIDLYFRIPRKESYKAGRQATFYSQTCIRFILNCIYGALFQLDRSGHQELLDKVGEKQLNN